jgi:hypothetical protein
MSDSEQATLPASMSDFVRTRCRICAAGQTITRIQSAAHGAGKGTYCLLLREWMTDAEGNGTISDCDRFEEKGATG